MQVKTVIRAAAMAAMVLGVASARTAAKDCAMDPLPTQAAAVTTAPAATEAPAAAVTEAPAPAATDAAATPAPATDVSNGDNSTPSGDDGDDDDSGDDDGDDGDDGASASTPAGGQQTAAGTVANVISFTGKDCGGAGGTYEKVTDIGSCTKTTVTTGNPVSPFDDDVTVSFRGPMNIYNIAVFDGSSGSSWDRVSWYENGGNAENMVFLNNHNIDYSGGGSPEGFATADGTGTATQSTPFSGSLAAASNPYGSSIYAEDKTGAEVHIMTSKQCGVDGVECTGAYDNDGTAFQGWTGAKKLFITKVDMPEGGAPNVPAIWMLNAQITRSGQYQCNCRGVGPAGGCGELDIAEVLEKDTSVVATHYYFYDGSVNPGNDRFAARPTDAPTTYITIIDESYGVKIIEIGADDFDFTSASISNEVVQQWEQA